MVPPNPEREVMLIGTLIGWPTVTLYWLAPGAMEKSGVVADITVSVAFIVNCSLPDAPTIATV
jgi:hypothetical protein